MASTPIQSGNEQEALAAGPSPSERHLQMERILANPTFQASPRRRLLLRYLVEETLHGRADLLKGYTIALAVFDRDQSFDPQSDPVVRLEARRLRRDLDCYYAGAGSHDRIRISIPRGGYACQFEWTEGGAGSSPVHSTTATDAPVLASPARLAEPDIHPAAIPFDPPESRDAGSHKWQPGWRNAVVAFVILLACVGAAAWVWSRTHGQGPDPMARGPTMIVLPFEALSAGEDDRFLASGLTQQLITNLMRFDTLRLYSLPASFAQDANADPTNLGRRLAVAYVVKGSLRSNNETVRVGAQLIDARSGQVLWSETYDRAMTASALLDVQDELAGSIATLLGQPYGVVNNDAADRLVENAIPSMPSYACMLRAYAYRRTFQTELYGPVRACLQEAIQRDPGYASGWAMLGWMHLDAVRFEMEPTEKFESEFAQAFTAARRAVELNPKSVLALQALSSINYYSGNYDEAERLQRQALALNPNDPDTLAQLGWRLAARGNWQEGLPYLQRAIDRTINPPGWYFNLISVYAYLQGDYPAALESAERSTADGSGMSWSFVAIAEGALGNKEAARHALAEMTARSPSLARDPAAGYRRHQPIESIVDRLVAGLRKAGWSAPATQTSADANRP
ncbi:tetratricopeptide repeat protein [Neorhizobium sp. P12A]|uniref:tetratricopeptide repeat protein n=1 Tax=Neorhizobium sp. P12A TaxID=2268027 RepID=UPI0011F04EB7|nr:tetratricopeptide repeat protein [Neorhizobium sp. P12A]